MYKLGTRRLCSAVQRNTKADVGYAGKWTKDNVCMFEMHAM